jgi:hypothetical protein
MGARDDASDTKGCTGLAAIDGTGLKAVETEDGLRSMPFIMSYTLSSRGTMTARHRAVPAAATGRGSAPADRPPTSARVCAETCIGGDRIRGCQIANSIPYSVFPPSTSCDGLSCGRWDRRSRAEGVGADGIVIGTQAGDGRGVLVGGWWLVVGGWWMIGSPAQIGAGFMDLGRRP